MIEVRGLTKRYGKLTAVDNLTFSVGRGDAFGFIGPNGAGKTTTIRMLATLLVPDQGTAYVNGYDVRSHPEEVRACLGYMPDAFGVYSEMRVWEYLDFFAGAYRVPVSTRAGLIRDVLELVDLSDRRDVYVDGLSRGMKQRLCLAKTLVHDPQVLLLDEPASGLDPRARIEMRSLLQELCKMDKTIIISSHILPELAELCNKIGVIEQGRMVMAGSVEEIGRQLRGGRRLRVRLAGQWDQACALLTQGPGVQSVEVVEADVLVTFVGTPEEQRRLLSDLIHAGCPVDSFAEEAADLEDLYMTITREANT
jgi:ABC-2 type transport system ATP-binding protein